MITVIFVANLRYTTRFLSDRNIFCSLRGGRTTAGSDTHRAFRVSTLRANVTNGQTFGGNRSKINSAHILMLGIVQQIGARIVAFMVKAPNFAQR